MDGTRFDDLLRAASARGSRRGALRALVAAALGVLAAAPAEEGQGKSKKKCPKKPCPVGQIRDKRTCKCACQRTPCSGGMEFDPKTCRCACPAGMRECANGCVGRDQCCPGDPPCPEDPKGCCHAPGLDVCTIDGCCRELDGMKACNDFCVDTTANRNHCGGCNVACGADEACVGGECRSEEPCPDGRARCQGPDGPFCAPEGHSCCGAWSCNAFNDCCDPAEGLCCPKGRCTGGRCCPEGRQTCGALCCPLGQVCCGGECCSAAQCVDGACCPTTACGGFGNGTKVCPTDDEVCCHGADNSGHACRAVEWGSACAPNGRCCPDGTFWDNDCQACCRDVLALCPNAGCVPATPGRT